MAIASSASRAAARGASTSGGARRRGGARASSAARARAGARASLASVALTPRNGKVAGGRRLARGVLALVRSEKSGRRASGLRVDEAQPAGAEGSTEGQDALRRLVLGNAAAFLALTSAAGDAMAKGGEFGLLEGRTMALIHPLMMGALLGATGWAGFLGWQWRRVRTSQVEINILKKKIPVSAEDGALLASPEKDEYDRLVQMRKDLTAGKYKDRHWNWGNVLLGSGVVFSIAGPINTFMRTGKLFPGPHLWAGAGITALWAVAASMVPYMQKGNETARSMHIGLNALGFMLFLWQVPTGLEIVGKVFQFTKWP